MALTASERPFALLPTPEVRTKKVLLPLVHRFQKKTLWCWVACLKMAWDTRRQLLMGQMQVKTLCEIVDEARDRNDCCTALAPSICTDAFPVARIKAAWRDVFQSVDPAVAPQPQGKISFAAIRTQIRDDRPVQIGVGPGGNGHAVMIYGFDEMGPQQWVWIRDPRVQSQNKKRLLFTEISGSQRFLDWQWSWTELPKVR